MEYRETRSKEGEKERSTSRIRMWKEEEKGRVGGREGRMEMDVGRRKRREEGEGGKKRSTRGLRTWAPELKQQWYSDRTHETLE